MAGCGRVSIVTLADPADSQEHATAVVAAAGPGQTVGQTFTTRHPRLNSLTLWVNAAVSSGAAGGGELQVELYRTPADEWPLYTQTIPFEAIASGLLRIPLSTNLYGSARVSTPTREGSTPTYYILLRPTHGTIQVRGRAEDIYPGGQAYVAQAPLEADFAFSTTYDYDLGALLADLRLGLPRFWLALPLLALLFLPGWLLLDLSGLRARFDSAEFTAIAIGLSLAVIPIAMLWSTVLGLRWGRTGLLFAAGLLLAVAFWRTAKPSRFSETWKVLTRPSSYLAKKSVFGLKRWLRHLFVPKAPAILWIIFLFCLAVRLVMARDLAAPAWVDSVHHAAITRLILEQGGFPATYAPYIDIDAAQYHAGFHSLLAAFQWLSGLETPEAMLLLGQVLNALIVFAAYLLAVTLTRQRSTGLAAAVIAGLFTPMPAYYTSWGRYTQLEGLLILPAGLALARLAIERPGRDVRFYVSTASLAAIACGGLFMVHYRVAGFLALLLLSFFLSRIRLDRLANARLLQRIALFGVGAGLLALLLTLPWSGRAITQVFAPKAAVVGGSTAKAFDGFSWDYLDSAWGLPAMILAGLGFLLSLSRRLSLAVSMALWTGGMLLAANLSALHLPGGWFVNTISVVIALFLPTAVLAGYALAQARTLLLRGIPRPEKTLFSWAWIILGIAVALLAARALLPLLRPSTELFRSPDRPALEWISGHVPAGETIVINPVYWGYNTFAGADGGYWITPLTGHKTIPPPVLYALGSPLEKQRMRTVCETILSTAADPAALAQYLRSHDLHYIYLGVRGGALSPRLLQGSGQFDVLYAQDGAWVFRVR